MNKKIRISIIVVVSVIAVAVLMLLTMNYLVPFVIEMHSGVAKY